MKFAKPHLDVGLFSNRRDEQLAFWQRTVGLAYDHMGKLGGGVQQHRHHMNGSILKLNHARDPLPASAPSGIVGLQIAREGLDRPQALADPDGNRVTLVPKGKDGMWNTFANVLHPAFPDLTVEIHDQIAEGDRVTTRKTICGTHKGAVMGVAPTGRAVTIDVIDVPELVMNAFAPSMTHSPVAVSSTALVRVPPASLPASGSVRPNAPRRRPATMSGSHRACCSALPGLRSLLLFAAGDVRARAGRRLLAPRRASRVAGSLRRHSCVHADA